MLALAVVTAMGEIARNGALRIPDQGEEGGVTKLSLVENLLNRITSGKESGKVMHTNTHIQGGSFIWIHLNKTGMVDYVNFLSVAHHCMGGAMAAFLGPTKLFVIGRGSCNT